MHLNKILEQIKRHQSPTEAIDKLATALEKHEGSLLEKGFTILKSELAANMYEAINGPHFDEEHAHYAVEGMENEDGTKGPHWTVEETTSVANQMGINLKSEKHNKWDWFVAMNMIYSDFYKAVVAMTGSANTKYFAELAKAWLCDKDISEGKWLVVDLHHRALLDVGRMGWKWLRSWKPSRNKFGFRSFSCYG